MVLDEPQNNEVSIPANGIDVLVEDDARGLADRARIDYVSGPYGEGFTVGLAGFSGC